MKKLKVWWGYTHKHYPEAKDLGERSLVLLVAAYSLEQASEIADVPIGYIRKYFTKTGSEFHFSVATEVGVWLLPAFKNTVIKRLI